MPNDPLSSDNTAKVALGVSFIAFCGILINVLYANHFNAKKRRYDGRKDCCYVINGGITNAFKANSREETFACEMQVLYGLIDLKRTQEARSLYEQFWEYWSPDIGFDEGERDHGPATTLPAVNTSRKGEAAEDHIKPVDIDVCSMYSFCFEELRLSGVRMQCLPLVDYLAKYYDVHFELPDRDDPNSTETRWKFRVEQADDDDYDEQGDTFDSEMRSPARSHASSVASANYSRHPSPGGTGLLGSSGGGGGDSFQQLSQISTQLSSLKEGDTVNVLFQEQQEERDRYVHTHPARKAVAGKMPKQHSSSTDTHVKQRLKQTHVQIRFKREKRAGSKANASLNADDYV
jgi:hypothetical protein